MALTFLLYSKTLVCVKKHGGFDILLEMLKVVLLGIVEGITEWLPISSTGHMLLVDEFIHLNMSDEFLEFFFVVIQLGAILAVCIVFFWKLWPFQGSKKKGTADFISLEQSNCWLYSGRSTWHPVGRFSGCPFL